MSDVDPRDQFAELFRQHYRDLYGYIFTLVRDFADAEDLLQETSVTLWEKFEEFGPETSFRAWACRIAKFKVLNFIRKSARRNTKHDMAFLERLADVSGESSLPHDDVRREALEHCVGNLSETQQGLLRDRYAIQQPVSQIAQQHQRTTESIYNALAYMRRGLMECIESYLAREVLE